MMYLLLFGCRKSDDNLRSDQTNPHKGPFTFFLSSVHLFTLNCSYFIMSPASCDLENVVSCLLNMSHCRDPSDNIHIVWSLQIIHKPLCVRLVLNDGEQQEGAPFSFF